MFVLVVVRTFSRMGVSEHVEYQIAISVGNMVNNNPLDLGMSLFSDFFGQIHLDDLEYCCFFLIMFYIP